MKVCNICKEKKSLSDFNKNKSRKDGLECHCSVCGISKNKKYYIENKEKKLDYCKKRKAENPALYKTQNNKYYARNKGIVLKKQKYEIDNLTDSYIKKSLKRYMNIATAPQEFIEAKRSLILIQRALRRNYE